MTQPKKFKNAAGNFHFYRRPGTESGQVAQPEENTNEPSPSQLADESSHTYNHSDSEVHVHDGSEHSHSSRPQFRGHYQTNSRYYRLSGIVGSHWVSALLKGIIAAMIFAPIHAYLMYWIASALFRFFVLVILVLIFGATLNSFGTSANIRNKPFLFWISCFCSLIALYISYCFWVAAWRTHFGANILFYNLLINPVELFNQMQILIQHGASQFSGDKISGGFAYIIWGLEAFGVVFCSSQLASSLLDSSPFCENCQKWIDQKVALHTRSFIDNTKEFVADLERSHYAPLLALRLADKEVPKGQSLADKPHQYSELQVRYCPTCRSEYYLDISNVRLTQGKKKSEPNTTTTQVVHFLIVPRNILTELQEMEQQNTTKPISEQI